MMFAAWLGAVLIGLALGLLGSGGSILTVPVLVYLAGEPEKLAIAESLAIVGLIALVGALPYAAQKSVDWRNVVWFGIPGILGTYLGAALSAYLTGPMQLGLFALVMLLAAGMMFRGKQAESTGERQAAWKIVIEGAVVGVLTGLVGVGGGFLIIPALVLLGGLPMRLAVGTSLFIIAAKSFAGFYKYLHLLADQGVAMNWNLILVFSAIGIVGTFIGNRLSSHIPQAALRQAFAVFLVVMGLFILWQQVPKVFAPSAATAVHATR